MIRKSTGNTWIDAISVGSDQQFELIYVDDLYVCDTSGIVNNIFLGPINIVPAYPNAAGGFTAFTAGGTLSGSNFGQLGETPPNGDTDYVQNSNVSDRDSYGYGDITLDGTILGAVLYGYAKLDTVSRSNALTARSDSVDSIGATQAHQQDNHYKQVFETDPNTSAGWLVAGLNAAEFGMEIAA